MPRTGLWQKNKIVNSTMFRKLLLLGNVLLGLLALSAKAATTMPAITTQPVAVNAAVGTSPTMTVAAGGTTPLVYQWYANGARVANATNATLAFPNVQYSAAAGYQVVITNSAGSVASVVATLTVVGPPVLTTQPASLTNATPGGTVTFAAVATANPAPLWKWYLQGLEIAGATNASLTFTNAQATDGGHYQVVAYNSLGQTQADCDFGFNLPSLPFADAFANRGTITGNSGLGAGNNSTASKEAYEPSHFTSKHDRSVWVQWTAPQSGIATFSTDGSGFDTVLAVYTGTALTNLVRVVNDDNSGGYLNSEVKFNATAGTSYALVVAGIGAGKSGAKGSIVLQWDLQVTASQLSYVTQQPLSTSLPPGGTLALTLNLSSSNLITPQIQWYFENAPLAGATSTNLVIANFQPAQVGFYRAYINYDFTFFQLGYFSQGADVQINTEGSTTVLAQNRQVDADLTPLSGSGGGPLAPLRARVTGTAVAGYSGSQIFATRLGKDPSEPNHCGVVGGSSYWLSYKAPTNGVLLLNTDGSTYDTILAVFIDDGLGNGYASLKSVACDNNSGANGLTSKLQFNCTNAVTYYIVVDGVNGAYGTAYLNYKLGRVPTIAAIAAQAGTEDTTKAVSVTIGDPDTALTNLVLFATSSNTNIVPVSRITFTGTGATRTVNILGATNANGAVTISLVVKDTDGLTATNSFTLTLAAVNDAPVAGTVTLTRPLNTSTKVLISTVLASCTDPDGNTLTLSAIATQSFLGAAITKDTTYIYYTALANKNTADYFTYTVKDPSALTSTGRINVNAQ